LLQEEECVRGEFPVAVADSREHQDKHQEDADSEPFGADSRPCPVLVFAGSYPVTGMGEEVLGTGGGPEQKAHGVEQVRSVDASTAGVRTGVGEDHEVDILACIVENSPGGIPNVHGPEVCENKGKDAHSVRQEACRDLSSWEDTLKAILPYETKWK